MANPTPYTLTLPELADAAAQAINDRLTAGNLSWLNAAYGVAEKRVKTVDGRNYVYPAIYTGGTASDNYLSLLPDALLFGTKGAYTYLEISEPQTLKNWQDGGELEAPFALVCWFDFRKIYPNDWQGRTVSNVIQLVLNELTKGTGQTAIDTDFEFSYSAERIYRGYSHQEIERQFLMKPYGGFRIDGTLYYFKPCP